MSRVLERALKVEKHVIHEAALYDSNIISHNYAHDISIISFDRQDLD